jgi:hypothetical protein
MLQRAVIAVGGGGASNVADVVTSTGNISSSGITTYSATQSCTIIAILQNLFYSAGYVKVKKNGTTLIESTINNEYVAVSYHLNSGENISFDCNTNASNMMYYIVND